MFSKADFGELETKEQSMMSELDGGCNNFADDKPEQGSLKRKPELGSGKEKAAMSKSQKTSNSEMSNDVDASMSVCLFCGKTAKSIEFILPDRYCSQSCADKNGCQSLCVSNSSSECGDAEQPDFPSNGHTSSHQSLSGKRKKKKASYLSAYEENFMMNTFDERKVSKTKKTRQFSWSKFLSEENLKEAPMHLFINEPKNCYIPNPFSVGQKLEGIDLAHPSKYCVLTVAEVKGLRLRLHFDGYSECYDFWTYANSDMIFPVGWCEENKKPLCPPKGSTIEPFSWKQYLAKAQAAPRECFSVCSEEYKKIIPAFKVGDKLEACDIKNNMIVCVASVADTYGDKVLIHFDGWEDCYDYWCSYNSPLIHYVGWCQENNVILSAPNGYADPARFTWESYIEQEKSRAAPREGFGVNNSVLFETGMALEVVDKRNPILIRVAEVLQIDYNRILIHFSGWDNKYDYWECSTSPDLHPIGWCMKTGHPLQPPISPVDIGNHNGPCPTPGCFGFGHVKGAKFSAHQSTFGCPYSDINLNKDTLLLDRLGTKRCDSSDTKQPPMSAALLSKSPSASFDGKFPTHYTSAGSTFAQTNQTKVLKNSAEDQNLILSPTRRKKTKSVSSVKRTRLSTSQVDSSHTDSISPHSDHKTAPVIKPLPISKPDAQSYLQSGIHNSIFLPSIPPSYRLEKELPILWDKNIKLLPGISNIQFTDVPKWSTSQVAEHLKTIIPSLTAAQIDQFCQEKIDGEAFLLLTQSDITSILKLKLGPALKVYNTVLVIKKTLGIL